MQRPWHHHARRHATRLSAVATILLFFLLTALAAAILTFSSMFTPQHPLLLTRFVPKIDNYVAGYGLNVETSKLEAFYSKGSLVLRAQDVRIYGRQPDGTRELAVTVEKASIDLSRRRLFLGIPAPREISATGVVLRLVRTNDTVDLAGVTLANTTSKPGTESNGSGMGGLVEWLNGVETGLRWGALEQAGVSNLTLLLRDNVQQAEWVLEDGQLRFESSDEGGQRAVMEADLRRLYGAESSGIPRVANTPVLLTLDHESGAEDATLRARFEKSDISMVADYFPQELQKMIQAKGRVEFGMLIKEGNRLGQPWLTLRLADVTITPPAGFSKPLLFKTFDVTAAYIPSPTDVLTISGLDAVDKQGLNLRFRGQMKGVTGGDPEAHLTLQIPGGDIQKVFNYFPDQRASFARALEWLRPNIKNARFTNLVLNYNGRPNTFPDCGEACGLTATARIESGAVQYLPRMNPGVVRTKGSFTIAGETLRVEIPTVTTGRQNATNVVVTLSELFSPDEPTMINVGLNLKGPLDEVISQVSKIEKPLPVTAGGAHESTFHLQLPLKRGEETKVADAEITVSSTISKLEITKLEDLSATSIIAPEAEFSMSGPIARLEAPKAALNALPLAFTWQDDWKTPGVSAMAVTAKGEVEGKWLTANGMPDDIQITGPVDISLTLAKQSSGTNAFTLTANAETASLTVVPLAWSKPPKQSMQLVTSGAYSTAAPTSAITSNSPQNSPLKLNRLQLNQLAVEGTNANVRGTVDWQRDNPTKTLAILNPFILGETDASVTWRDGILNLQGRKLDLSKFDIMGDDKDDKKPEPDLTIRADMGRMKFAKGDLENVHAYVVRKDNITDLELLQALNNGKKVNVVQTKLPGGKDRRRMSVNIEDLGGLLNTLDIYEPLRNGKLEGDIIYDAPRTGSGRLTLTNFQLHNPPTLARLLSLLSLEQLLSGTDELMFDKATIPLKLEGPMVYLKQMSLDGPAMTLRFNGTYNRSAEQLNLDGKLAPAIPLNRLVAQIPIVGTILAGSQEGVVVADFKMKGSADDPEINVSPLSVLTPGLLKDFFNSF